MASVKERAVAAFGRLRAKRPFVDHLVRMQQHYGSVQGSQQAGAITYFGFLSFFPILALAFFVVGYAAKLYPGIEGDLVDGISQVLPGLVGNSADEISLEDIQGAAGAVGLIGLLGVLYSGLGWLSSLRDGLTTAFEKPAREQPNFVIGKLRDLLTLALIGLILVLSVSVSQLVTTYSNDLLDLVELDETLAPLLAGLSVVLGLAASTVLFFAIFQLLAAPHAPRRSVWQGALFGAIGFEVLKQLSRVLLASTKDQPAFQAFGIALILVVWINYFSRVTLYAAAFAHTSRAAREKRVVEAGEQDSAVSTPGSVMAAAMVAGAAPGSNDRNRGSGTWMDDFVEKIDAADPDEVGEASAEAARVAHRAQQAATRQRLLALGALGSVAGIAVAALRRKSG